VCPGAGSPRLPGAIAVLDGTTGRRRATLFRPGTVTAVAFSPDGRLLAAGCSRLDTAGRRHHEVSLWDVDSGRELRTLPAFEQAVFALAFSPDGRLLAAGGEGGQEFTDAGPAMLTGQAKLWDVSTGRERAAFTTSNRVYALSFSPDGGLLAAGSGRFQAVGNVQTGGVTHAALLPIEGEVKLWDVAAGKERVTLGRHSAGVRALAFSPDGRLLATASLDSIIKLWDLAAGRELHSLPDYTSAVHALAFSPDGKSLASASRDGIVTVWNPSTGQAQLTFSARETVELRAAAFRADSLGLNVAGLGTDSATHAPVIELRSLGARPEPVLLPDAGELLALSPDGTTLATTEALSVNPSAPEADRPRTVKLWDLTTGQAREQLAGHMLPIRSLTYSADGKVLASVANQDDLNWWQEGPFRRSRPGEVKLWDPASGQKLPALPGLTGLVRAVAFQPGGALVAVAGGVAESGEEARKGRGLATWLSGEVRLFDTKTGQPVRALTGHRADVRAVIFSADGARLSALSCDADGPEAGPSLLQTWDAATGRELLSTPLPVRLPSHVLFTADGRRLIAAAGGQLRVWDVASGKEEHTLAGHPEPVNAIRFTPDGKTAITSCSGGVRVWDVATLQESYDLPEVAWDVSLTPGGLQVHAWGWRFFDLASGRRLASFTLSPDPLVSSDGQVIVGGKLINSRDDAKVEVVRRPAPGSGEAPRSVVIEHFPPYGSGRFLTPDGRTLIAWANGVRGYKLWDTATGKERGVVPMYGWTRLSPDGKVLAISNNQDQVLLWDVAANKSITTWENPDARRSKAARAAALAGLGASPICLAPMVASQRFEPGREHAINFSPDGRTVLLSSAVATWLLEAATGRQVAVWGVGVGALEPMSFSPDGKFVAIPKPHPDPAPGANNNLWSMRLLELPSGRLLAESPPLSPNSLKSLFTGDGKVFILCNENYDPARGERANRGEVHEPCVVMMWDTATGRTLRTLERAPGPVSLSPDGRTLLSQSLFFDAAGRKWGEAAWWDVATGRECGRLPEVMGPIVWAPDGRSLFPPTADGVRRLRTADGAEVARFAGGAAPLAVAPDGRSLLAAVPEGVRVWDLGTGQARGTVRHQTWVTAVGVHPEGPRLVSLTEHGAPKYWDLGSGQELVPASGDLRFANHFLDGRTRWARELSRPAWFWKELWEPSPTLHLAKTSAAGPDTLLAGNRFRLVAETQSLKLWPNGQATPASATETASGVDLVHKGRLDAAVTAFRKAAQLAPAEAEPRLLLANALDRRGKHDEALAALDEACGIEPSCAWMFADLARPLLAKSQHDRALELLGKAVRYRPHDAALRFQLGEAFARGGALEKAVGCYEKAAELYPDHGEASARRADALTALGRAEQGKQARGRAAEISPGLGSPARAQLAQTLAERVRKEADSPFRGGDSEIGSRLLENSYLDEAIDHLWRAALNGSGNPDTYSLATALMRRGQYPEALRVHRFRNRSIPPDATEWRDWAARHSKYLERGPQLDVLRREVLKHEAAFRRHPTDTRAGRTLADAYVRVSEDRKTPREWLAPDSKLPDYPELWCNLAGLLLLGQETDLYRRLGPHAAEFVKKRPEGGGFADVNMYLIVRLWNMAEKPPVETARVVELAQQPIRSEFAAGRLHALGLACYRAGKYEDAIRHLNECVTGHPEWGAQVLNYQVLALAYYRLSKDDEARRWRAKATAWIDRTAEEVAWAAPYAWPLQPYDLLAMWLLERELARALPAAGRSVLYDCE
jgi:WD40 repeat protein/tetratricopeptide (TPR) repeat protein